MNDFKLNRLASKVVNAAIAEGDGQPGFDVDPRPDTAGLGELADSIVDAAERLAGLVDRSGTPDPVVTGRMRQVQRMLSDLVERVDSSHEPATNSMVRVSQNQLQRVMRDFPNARSI